MSLNPAVVPNVAVMDVIVEAVVLAIQNVLQRTPFRFVGPSTAVQDPFVVSDTVIVPVVASVHAIAASMLLDEKDGL